MKFVRCWLWLLHYLIAVNAFTPSLRASNRLSELSFSRLYQNLNWRLHNVEVPLEQDPGKDFIGLHDGLLRSIERHISLSSPKRQNKSSKTQSKIDELCDIKVVKKSFDCRIRKLPSNPKQSGKVAQFVYTVDLRFNDTKAIPKTLREKDQLVEILLKSETLETNKHTTSLIADSNEPLPLKPRVVVVGAGPAGLFAALTLVDAGFTPVIIERGEAVEQRGRAIGALFNRHILNPESNLCYGEGGAGTWSDGKLTTRIGKNSEAVRNILETLVRHGAKEKILVDNKPHLGTDKLIGIIKSMRKYLLQHGAEIHFNTVVTDFDFMDVSAAGAGRRREVKGVYVRRSGLAGLCEERIPCEYLILAAGHSAREIYAQLARHGVCMRLKEIAAGFRIEHRQELINEIQLGEFAGLCARGKGKVPVADYKLTTEVTLPSKDTSNFNFNSAENIDEFSEERNSYLHSYSSASTSTSTATSTSKRSVYSFCMCPGGQIVPTSIRPTELCINGMSFSQRQSAFANSALVVNVNLNDMLLHRRSCENDSATEEVLAGVLWQEEMERRASELTSVGSAGAGSLVVPVMRATDFVLGRNPAGRRRQVSNLVERAPIGSSYRLGVRESDLTTIYPHFLNDALARALEDFNKKMPGFLCHDAILHGVETRTSSPIRIDRDNRGESLDTARLYPTGEGAGYAGGIVSAAVDGVKVAKSIIQECVQGYSVA